MNFTNCSVCQKLGVFKPRFANEQLPPHYDIPGEGECRLDEVPIEVAPCEEWLLDEVELKTVTFSNMSIDSKRRYREITVRSRAGESVANPDEWPNFDLKPSKGSVKGQRYAGPGGE